MEIDGRRFIVTVAGSGLGAATARRLAELGGRVLIADVNSEAGEAMAAELGPNARFARRDVTDTASAVDAISAFRSAFGALHGLVNYAGVAPSEKLYGREGPHSLDSFA